MRNLAKNSKKHSETGAALVECALLVALIALIGVVSINTLGQQVNFTIGTAVDGFESGGTHFPQCDPFNPTDPSCNP